MRDENAIYLNAQLAQLPGIRPMRRDKRETAEAYYNFSFRYSAEQFKGLPVARFREALAAELGCAVDSSYKPLNACSLYTPHTKPWRYKLTEKHWKRLDPARFDLPVCRRVFERESVCFHHKVLMGAKADMDQIVEAIRKLYALTDELR